MKIVIDTDTGKLMVAGPQGVKELPLSSPAGSELLTQLAQAGCSSSSFTWAGQPVQEHPDVLFRLQEAIHQVRPRILVQTGKTTAGTLLYLFHVLRQFDGEQVWSIDGDVPHDADLTATRIELITGDAAGLDDSLKSQPATPRMLVLLGACSNKAELGQRLETYSTRLPMGSAILSMELLTVGELQAKHAAEAFAEFAMEHPEYRGEFLSGRNGTGLAPLLIRIRA